MSHAAPVDKRSVLLFGPSLKAVSGVATHLQQLLSSDLAREFRLNHFQVGSEGRSETPIQAILRLLVSPFTLVARLARRPSEIVHLNTSFEHKSYWRDLVYLVATRLLRCKTVYQVHGGALPQEMFMNSRALTWLCRQVLRLPDAIVLLATVEVEAYERFVPQKRILMIPNAIDPSELLSAAKEPPGSRPLNLVYVGRLAEDKGIFEIVQAVELLKSRGVHVVLSIAGSGPDQASLAKAIADAQLADRVALLGPLFDADKNRLWQKADVFTFPTYHREGLPYALLESMAAGAVPIVSPMGGIRDVIENGVQGVFVPPKDANALADAIASLDADRSLLARLSEAGRERIRDYYTVERLAEDFRALYRSL